MLAPNFDTVTMEAVQRQFNHKTCQKVNYFKVLLELRPITNLSDRHLYFYKFLFLQPLLVAQLINNKNEMNNLYLVKS